MDVQYIQFKLYIHLWVLLLLITPISETRFYTFHEGQDANMRFCYDRAHQVSGRSIEIQMANRVPFYINGNISNAGLSDDQLGRFNVTEHEETETEMHKYLILFQIKLVTRSDGGTYICSVYNNGTFVRDLTQRIGLTVIYAPGRASCHFENTAQEMDKEWTIIECTAPLGNYFGFFDCYQTLIKMPHLTHVTQNRTHFKQTLIARKNRSVMCCTTNYVRPTKRHACKDFIWYPSQGVVKQDQNSDDDSHMNTDGSERSSTEAISSDAPAIQSQDIHVQDAAADQILAMGHANVIWFAIGSALSAFIMGTLWCCYCAKTSAKGHRNDTGEDVNSSQPSSENEKKLTPTKQKMISVNEETDPQAKQNSKYVRKRSPKEPNKTSKRKLSY